MNAKALIVGLVALVLGAGAGVGWGFQAREAAVRSKQDDLDALQKKLDEANARAKSEHDRAEQSAADMKVATDAAASLQKKAVAEITSAANYANELFVKAQTLASDLQTARANAVAEVASIQATAEAKVDQAMKAVAGMQASMQTALTQSSSAAQAEISRLNGALADQKKNLDALQGQLGQLQQQAKELVQVKGQLASAQQEAASWKQQADAANARAAQLDQRAAQLTEELRLLRQGGLKGVLGK